MSVDAICPTSPIGMTVPPPPETVLPVERSGHEEVRPPLEAPLPSYQGRVVDESV